MWEYTEKTKEYFTNPINVGEVENPDGIGEVGSLACGDALRLTFKLDSQGRIAEAKFQTFGCASAIASSSVLTELIKGRTLEEAGKITNQDIADFLGGLPPEKMHCSVMGEEALRAAIRHYYGQDKIQPEEGGEIVCQCFGVSREEIERVARSNNLRSAAEVTNYTKAGGACGKCLEQIEEILARLWQSLPQPLSSLVPPRPAKLTTIKKLKLVEETLEREVKPLLRADGGDIELIDINGDVVQVALRGNCSSCQASQNTLGQLVQNKLREFVTPDIIVEEVKA
jgi:NifU-like protein